MDTTPFDDPELVTVTTNREGDIAVVRVAGELDQRSCPPFEAAVRIEMAQHPKGIVIDMRDVTFCASAGLRVLIQAHYLASTADIGLRFITANPYMLRLFKVTGLAQLFEIRDSVPDAVIELTV